VTSLEHLELAARSGLLARVSGIGPLTVERVLRDLDARQQAQLFRPLLSEALALVDALVAWMLDDPTPSRPSKPAAADDEGKARQGKARQTEAEAEATCTLAGGVASKAHGII
jgi:hypothetical protein